MSDGALGALLFYIVLVVSILSAILWGEHARKKKEEEKSLRFRLTLIQAKEDETKEKIHKKI